MSELGGPEPPTPEGRGAVGPHGGSGRPPLLSLDEALARLAAGAASSRIAEVETVSTFDALGRVLARDLVSPIDVVPELVPVVGAMDDLVVGLAGLWLFVRLCPPPVVREHVVAIAAEARG